MGSLRKNKENKREITMVPLTITGIATLAGMGSERPVPLNR